MDGKDVAKRLVSQLLDLNFIVHRYNSHSTSSIYLKLDYGLSYGIRIADHQGKRKYHYRFNVIKNYMGNKAIKNGPLISYFFDYTEIEKVIDAVKMEKQRKIDTLGIRKYKDLMYKQSKSDLYQRFKKMKGVPKK